MEEKDLKQLIAKNIAYYRKTSNLTQSELAEKINYTDKSISKWERGEGLPDIIVLNSMSEIFGVSLNELISEEPKPINRIPVKNRVMIPLMSICLVWLVASLVYIFFRILFPGIERAWLVLIYSVPVACIVTIVFMELWWNVWATLVAASVLFWSIAASIFLTFDINNLQTVFIIAADMQVLAILWCIFKYDPKGKKK